MPKYELLIACVDEPEAHRKKEGDIVAVRPYPWSWGAKEVDQYFLVIIETDEDLNTMRGIYEMPFYEGGLDCEPPDDINVNPKKLAKNRFQIPLDIIKNGWMPSLDLVKVRDKKKIYQPLKDADIVIDTKEKVSLIWDKYKESYRYSTLKVTEIG